MYGDSAGKSWPDLSIFDDHEVPTEVRFRSATAADHGRGRVGMRHGVKGLRRRRCSSTGPARRRRTRFTRAHRVEWVALQRRHPQRGQERPPAPGLPSNVDGWVILLR